MVYKWISRATVKAYKWWEMALGLILPSSVWDFRLTELRNRVDP